MLQYFSSFKVLSQSLILELHLPFPVPECWNCMFYNLLVLFSSAPSYPWFMTGFLARTGGMHRCKVVRNATQGRA